METGEARQRDGEINYVKEEDRRTMDGKRCDRKGWIDGWKRRMAEAGKK